MRVLVSPPPEEPPSPCFSPSDGGIAGVSVCGDVARGSPERFGGGGALGEVVAVSLSAIL